MIPIGIFAQKRGSSGGDPYWNNVVALLRFNNNVNNEVLNGIKFVESNPLIYASGKFDDCFNADSAPNAVTLDVTESYPDDLSFLHWSTMSYTVELWLNPYRIPSIGCFFSTGGSASASGGGMSLWIQATGNPIEIWIRKGSTIISSTGSFSLPINAWTHIAATYDVSTSTHYLFVGGIKVWEGVNSTGGASNVQTPLTLGRYLGNYSANCKIDELRITKGICRYTEDFIPPDAPFPNS